jgi:purine nucleosidase
VSGDRVPLLVDTDLGTNVDDALALAYAARHPTIDLQAVVTVSGDTLVRGRLARSLLRAAGRDDVVVAAGIPGFADRAWSGREGAGMPPGWETEEIPVQGWHRVLAAHRGTVATIGMLSNVAELVRVGMPLHASRLVVMGGLFPPADLPPQRDHNLATDPEGALVALTAGIPLMFVPIDVTIRTALYPSHVERLRGGDAFCVLLADLLDAFVPRTGHAMAGDRIAHLHDPLAIACAVGNSFVEIERLPVTVARVGDAVRTFLDPVAGVDADVVRGVDGAAFAEHWLDVVLQGSA